MNSAEEVDTRYTCHFHELATQTTLSPLLRKSRRQLSIELMAGNKVASLTVFAFIAFICAFVVESRAITQPPPPGRLVDLGGHHLHINCTGNGQRTVVIENGLGDFSFDWVLVQAKVSTSTRVCTYDRAGYAWSDPGPKPRTFAQINLELRDVLSKIGERGPFVLVGHSYGGPVVRNFAVTYSRDVVAMVLVDAAFEGDESGLAQEKLCGLATTLRVVQFQSHERK
jgi:alpha/beta hydrolase family protein